MVTAIAKKAVSIRLDSDVLDWFKEQGKGGVIKSEMGAVKEDRMYDRQQF